MRPLRGDQRPLWGSNLAAMPMRHPTLLRRHSDDLQDSEPEMLDAASQWLNCTTSAKTFDEALIRGWKEEMDTLLVFGALFSAVITAFIVDSYKWLVESNSSTVVLLQISSQLSTAFNTTVPAATPNSDPSKAQIVINGLWITSLILSLNSILMAILIKQWLSDYSWTSGTASARQTLAVRQSRFDSLSRWHVTTIIECLPLQLILALFIFLVGFVYLLFTMHRGLAILAIVLCSLPLVFFISTSVMPIFNFTCAFRSVQASLLYSFLRTIGAPLKYNWNGYFEYILGQNNIRYDVEGLRWIHGNICPWSPPMFRDVSKCARSLEPTTLGCQTLCTLFVDSARNMDVAMTEDHAKAWFHRVGMDEFCASVKFLCNPVQDLSSPANSETLSLLVKVFALFCVTLSKVDYLDQGHDTTLRTGFSVLLDLAISDKFSLERLGSTRTFVLNLAEKICASAPVGGMITSASKKEYPHRLLFTKAVEACKNIDRRTTAREEDYLLLSTIALHLSRHLDFKVLEENQIHEQISCLIHTMATFLSGAANAQPKVQKALNLWLPALCGHVQLNPNSSLRYNHDLGAVYYWQAIHDKLGGCMGELLAVLERISTLHPDVCYKLEVQRNLLFLLFAKPEVMIERYISSAKYSLGPDLTKGALTPDHADWWMQNLTPPIVGVVRRRVAQQIQDTLASYSINSKDTNLSTATQLLRIHTLILRSFNHPSYYGSWGPTPNYWNYWDANASNFTVRPLDEVLPLITSIVEVLSVIEKDTDTDFDFVAVALDGLNEMLHRLPKSKTECENWSESCKYMEFERRSRVSSLILSHITLALDLSKTLESTIHPDDTSTVPTTANPAPLFIANTLRLCTLYSKHLPDITLLRERMIELLIQLSSIIARSESTPRQDHENYNTNRPVPAPTVQLWISALVDVYQIHATSQVGFLAEDRSVPTSSMGGSGGMQALEKVVQAIQDNEKLLQAVDPLTRHLVLEMLESACTTE